MGMQRKMRAKTPMNKNKRREIRRAPFPSLFLVCVVMMFPQN
jgi:hypothetical protein